MCSTFYQTIYSIITHSDYVRLGLCYSALQTNSDKLPPMHQSHAWIQKVSAWGKHCIVLSTYK